MKLDIYINYDILVLQGNQTLIDNNRQYNQIISECFTFFNEKCMVFGFLLHLKV